MGIDNLTFNLMHKEISHPNEKDLHFLNAFGITNIIGRIYESSEDRADAFDGAFTACHINRHLREGNVKEAGFDEILGWYNYMGQKRFDSPFYFGLERTLRIFGFKNFYEEAVAYVKKLAANEQTFP